jgi:uncharacterized damage-inducible protein DinB
MAISQALLPEFDHEMANTRKTIERVPDDKFDWKPHEKSSAMGALATHLSNIPSWAGITINMAEFDMSPGGVPMKTQAVNSTAEVLAQFDKNVAEARTVIEGASDEHLFGLWTLLANGTKVLSMPRAACIRSFVMSHIVHHRAQLGVYLRLNDIPVPSIYGPSADEEAF